MGEQVKNGNKRAKLYCLGVGPGDPELLTIKGLRLLQEVDYLAAPLKDGKPGLAWQIVKALPELNGLEEKFLALDIPMTSDSAALKRIYDREAEKLAELLNEGHSVAVLTVGDPSFYATAYELYSRLSAQGFETELIPAVSSIFAVAAKAGMELASGSQNIKIIPSSLNYEQLREELLNETYDSYVLMKAAKIVDPLRELIQANFKDYQAVVAAKVGFPDELIINLSDTEEGYAWPYFTTILLKIS